MTGSRYFVKTLLVGVMEPLKWSRPLIDVNLEVSRSSGPERCGNYTSRVDQFIKPHGLQDDL